MIDLRNQTTVNEAIEISKHASCYAGIDSFPAVITTKFLPADKIFISTHKLASKDTYHLENWSFVYHFPHEGHQICYSPIPIPTKFKFTPSLAIPNSQSKLAFNLDAYTKFFSKEYNLI
jgi:hypothetical protein